MWFLIITSSGSKEGKKTIRISPDYVGDGESKAYWLHDSGVALIGVADLYNPLP